MKLFKSDIQEAARQDLSALASMGPEADPTGIQRAALEAVAYYGDEAYALETARRCREATELRHMFACADRVTAELGEVSR